MKNFLTLIIAVVIVLAASLIANAALGAPVGFEYPGLQPVCTDLVQETYPGINGGPAWNGIWYCAEAQPTLAAADEPAVMPHREPTPTAWQGKIARPGRNR